MWQAAGNTVSERRADIDYLRVGALLLLIIYHVMLVYNPQWWRVKSDYEGAWAEYFVNILTPWRMSLVFLIGGMAARFMMERMSTGGFVLERAGKLLTAFVFAVIVLIPLQRYVRLDNEHAQITSYFEFLVLRARYAVEEYGVWLPDFANAWFLPYLFVYSALAAVVWRFAPRLMDGLQHLIDITPIWAMALIAMGWFALVEAAVLPTHPMSGLLFPDIAAHMRFAPVFLFGLLIGKNQRFTEKLLAAKTHFWLLALTLLVTTLAMQWGMQHRGVEEWVRTEWLTLRGFYGAAMLFSVLAFASWALTKPTPLLTWASDAILPVYLMHQTVLVVAADSLVGLHLPFGAEFTLILAAALLIPIAIYVIAVRHTPWLRVLFGLRAKAKPWRTKQRDGELTGETAQPH